MSDYERRYLLEHAHWQARVCECENPIELARSNGTTGCAKCAYPASRDLSQLTGRAAARASARRRPDGEPALS